MQVGSGSLFFKFLIKLMKTVGFDQVISLSGGPPEVGRGASKGTFRKRPLSQPRPAHRGTLRVPEQPRPRV